MDKPPPLPNGAPPRVPGGRPPRPGARGIPPGGNNAPRGVPPRGNAPRGVPPRGNAPRPMGRGPRSPPPPGGTRISGAPPNKPPPGKPPPGKPPPNMMLGAKQKAVPQQGSHVQAQEIPPSKLGPPRPAGGRPPGPSGSLNQPPRPAVGGRPPGPSGSLNQPPRPAVGGRPPVPSGNGPPRPAAGGRPSVPSGNGPPRPAAGGRPPVPSGNGPPRPAAGGRPPVPSGNGPPRPAAGGRPPVPSGNGPPRPAAGGRPPVPSGNGPPRPAAGGRPPVPSGNGPPRPAGGRPPVPSGNGPPRPAGGRPPVPSGNGPPRPAGGRPPVPSGNGPPRPAGGRPPVPSANGPPRPAGGPPRPSGDSISGRGPPRPAGGPPRPSGGPPRPSGDSISGIGPPRPTGGPPRPAGGPPRPAGGPPRPSGRGPPRPAGGPPRPSGRGPPRPSGRGPPVPAGGPPRPAGKPPPPGGARPPPPSDSSKPQSPPAPQRPSKPLPPSGNKPAPPGGPRPGATKPRPPAPGSKPGAPGGKPPPPTGGKPPPPGGNRPSGVPGSPPPPDTKPTEQDEDETILPPALPPPPEDDDDEMPAPPPGEPQDDDDLVDGEFADRPPDEIIDDQVEAPKELPKLIPGRFIVTVTEAFGLSKHDVSAGVTQTKIDPYIQATLGKNKKANAGKHKSKVLKHQGRDITFNETMVFNMTDPEILVEENNIKLYLSIYHSNVLSDSLLGEAEISMLPLLKDFQREGDFQLYYQKKKKDPKQRAGAVHVRILFRPAKRGYLIVNCMEGKKMKNMELMGKQDPYCKFEVYGQKAKRTKTIKNGGTDCSFNDEEVRLWIDSTAWVEDMTFSCYDEDIGADDLIGAKKFDLLDFMSEARNAEEYDKEGLGKLVDEFFDIHQGKHLDKHSGQVRLKIQFLPAATLTITTIEARHLVDKDTMGKQDPFVVYLMDSDSGTSNFKVKTKTDTDGGTDPRWDEITTLPVVDHHDLTMEVYDEDMIGSNDLIGKASFSLLSVYRKGVLDKWITLKNKDKWGRVTKCGEVHIQLDFKGPPGVGYPLLQPDMDSFDESERENNAKKEETSDESGGDQQGQEGVDPSNSKPGRPPGSSDEFTDDDIEAAFNFIDLNKNGFIGAGEIRHILVCMGELITDEEVDEMIRMVDSDGDGQVSFEEFFALMVHPDPGGPNFSTKVGGGNGGGPALGSEAKSIAKKREEEAAIRQEKIELMRLFQQDNEFSIPSLTRAFEKFRMVDRGNGNTGLVDFATMCEILYVEPVGEYKKLFKVLDTNGINKINMRELLLGVSNFTGAQKEARCNFCFTLFDEDGNGTLSREELTEILKANHLATDVSSVKRKVNTVMKQCDRDGSGEIDRDEFLIVARKFPTILFPNYEQYNE